MGFVFNLHHLVPGESWTSFLILYVLYKILFCILYIFLYKSIYYILCVCVIRVYVFKEQTQDGIRYERDLLRKNLKKKNMKDQRYRAQI